jgi:hypothetical protein
MEFLVIGGLLFLLYQSGTLAPLGFIPGSSFTQSPAQAISNIISQQEQAAYGATGNQGPGYNVGASIGSSAFSGISSGASIGGPAGAAAGAAVGLAGAVTSIFNGMAIRAQQARVENQALNYAVQAFDRALGQVNAAYNNGSIQPQDALALLSQIFQQYWGVTASKIQPNRNGCSNGAGCPGTAMQYAATNGVPAGFCAGTNGATCCVGCGPIRLSIERCIAAVQQGGGVVTIAEVWGDQYGLTTRMSYQLTWGHA